MNKYDFDKVCETVLENCKNEYAKSYANAGLSRLCGEQDQMRNQLLYIKCNLNTWRGDLARETTKKINEMLRGGNKL